jgi:membrane-associated phospholipid phosphatase
VLDIPPVTTQTHPPPGPVPAGPPDPPRPRWWREVGLIAVFYAAYTSIRDIRGTRGASAIRAFADARRVIGFERSLGVFHEAQIQHAFLGQRALIEGLDDWYGSTHFIVTAGVLVALFLGRSHRYRQWRNTLAVATAVALIGFAWFPLMPPRLLPARYGFTDTLRVIGGLWNFNSGPMAHLSDQYAAMPSLHFAWALWCGLALFSLSRRWWTRALSLTYPAVTLLCVIVTANHYFTDTAAGAVIIGAGYLVSRGAEAVRSRLRTTWAAAPTLPLSPRPLGPAAAQVVLRRSLRGHRTSPGVGAGGCPGAESHLGHTGHR